jgi:uncharacterized membrane protein YphA (DoxX/SURF4 family)
LLLLSRRVILRGFFVFNGLNHFMSLGMMTGYVGSKRTPAPKVAMVGSGMMLVVDGLSLVLGFLPMNKADLDNFVSIARELRYTQLLGGGRRR